MRRPVFPCSEDRPPARIVIYGAGAIGGVLGARLFEHGHEVVLIARGPHYEAMRDHGLRIETPVGVTVVQAFSIPTPGILDVGRYPGGKGAVAENMEAAFRSAMFSAEARDDIMPWKYTKHLGRLYGVPTPANDLLQQAANEAARLRRPPGSSSADQLLAGVRP